MNQASRKGITRSPNSKIDDAWRRNLLECPVCAAGYQSPCQTPSGRPRLPHRGRKEWRKP